MNKVKKDFIKVGGFALAIVIVGVMLAGMFLSREQNIEDRRARGEAIYHQEERCTLMTPGARDLHNVHLRRVKAPGGWLVTRYSGSDFSTTYVPDPEHAWEWCGREPRE